jgi:TonB family protein
MKMKCPKIFLVAAGLMISAPPNAYAGEIKVIANSTLKADTISVDELKRIFLEENRSLYDGTHVEPVLEKDGSAHQAFLQQYLGRTDDDLQTFYRALVFTGKGSIPKELGSDAEVVAYVSRTRGAIGYVSAEASTEGVKTLAIARPGNSVQRRLITHIEPDYPETLKRLKIGGTVRLQVTISAKGNVENIQLLGGNPILAESAISAVKQWMYSTSHSRTTAVIDIPFDTHP